MQSEIRKRHWEDVYNTREPDEVSWYQENPKTSLDLILSVSADRNARIIDVGGGSSKLVDGLIGFGFKDLSVLDISSGALEKSRLRLGHKSKSVNWIESDVLSFKTDKKFDIWHDRATFHFLTGGEDIAKYVATAHESIKPRGYLIVATFSQEGPKKCSGLDIARYSEDSIEKTFGENFKRIKSVREVHLTPSGKSQSFIYAVLKRSGV